MATSAMRFKAAQPAAIDQRRDIRYSVDVKRATVRPHGDFASDAELVDISAYGCRLATPLTTEPGGESGERLWLRFAGRPAIAATLVWRDGGMLGCRFDAPLATAFVRALTLRLI